MSKKKYLLESEEWSGYYSNRNIDTLKEHIDLLLEEETEHFEITRIEIEEEAE